MNAFLFNNKSTQTSSNYTPIDYINKPVIIYYFINPFCDTYWDIEPILKKLTMEYGAFCSIRPVISHLFLGPKNNKFEDEQSIHSLNTSDKYSISIAIKAAALQGNKAGSDYLRNIQGSLFLYQNEAPIETIIHHAAKQTNIDVHEFNNDLFSTSAKKAYESDRQLTHEMEVKQFPTFVFLSQHIEDYSIKVAGIHSYETYTFILEKVLEMEVVERSTPSCEDFLKLFKRFTTEDLAFVLDMTVKEAEKSLKKLQLMQKVNKVQHINYSFWEIRKE